MLHPADGPGDDEAPDLGEPSKIVQFLSGRPARWPSAVASAWPPTPGWSCSPALSSTGSDPTGLELRPGASGRRSSFHESLPAPAWGCGSTGRPRDGPRPEARPCGQQSCSRPPPGDGVFLHQRGGGGDRPGLVVHPLPALLARVLGRRAGVVEAFGHLGDRVEVLDWGRARPNQMLTLKALRVLAGAGHLSWAAPRSESDAG